MTIPGEIWVTLDSERRPDDRRHASEGPQHGGQPAQPGALPRCLGRTKGGLHSALHAVCNGTGKPVRLLLTAGQTSDATGARHLLPRLPRTQHLIAGRGNDADGLVAALKKNGITPGLPPRNPRTTPRRYSKPLYNQRHKIESLFGRLKDWRRIAMRYDRGAHPCFSALCIAATVLLSQISKNES